MEFRQLDRRLRQEAPLELRRPEKQHNERRWFFEASDCVVVWLLGSVVWPPISVQNSVLKQLLVRRLRLRRRQRMSVLDGTFNRHPEVSRWLRLDYFRSRLEIRIRSVFQLGIFLFLPVVELSMFFIDRCRCEEIPQQDLASSCSSDLPHRFRWNVFILEIDC